mmetsp:Transcript_34855/g.87295  ORF Transcript_34855/g.87295 Transcript_34855/m.87295 type:complete len:250 (-) Transcript_34855:202-951(-)
MAARGLPLPAVLPRDRSRRSSASRVLSPATRRPSPRPRGRRCPTWRRSGRRAAPRCCAWRSRRPHHRHSRVTGRCRHCPLAWHPLSSAAALASWPAAGSPHSARRRAKTWRAAGCSSRPPPRGFDRASSSGCRRRRSGGAPPPGCFAPTRSPARRSAPRHRETPPPHSAWASLGPRPPRRAPGCCPSPGQSSPGWAPAARPRSAGHAPARHPPPPCGRAASCASAAAGRRPGHCLGGRHRRPRRHRPQR